MHNQIHILFINILTRVKHILCNFHLQLNKKDTLVAFSASAYIKVFTAVLFFCDSACVFQDLWFLFWCTKTTEGRQKSMLICLQNKCDIPQSHHSS